MDATDRKRTFARFNQPPGAAAAGFVERSAKELADVKLAAHMMSTNPSRWPRRRSMGRFATNGGGFMGVEEAVSVVTILGRT